MTFNYPGPYGVRIFYTSGGRDHKLEVNVQCQSAPDPGDLFSTITLITKAGGTTGLDTFVDAFAAAMKPLLPASGGVINSAELWYYTPGTFDALFISSYDISEAATGGTLVPASEVIITFRTIGGSVVKLAWLDGVTPAGARVSPAAFPGSWTTIAALYTQVTSPIIGRDGTFCNVVLFAFPGQNERLFKQVYRP